MNTQLQVFMKFIKRLTQLESRMKAVEQKPSQVIINKIFNSIDKAEVTDGHLVITMLDGKKFNAGNVKGINGENIKGDPGENGVGIDGLNGNDGQSVELVRIDNHIAWKYQDSEALNPLISLEELKGLPGRPGLPGKDGLDGNHGRGIASIDIQRNGDVFVELTDGEIINAGRVHITMGGGGLQFGSFSGIPPINYNTGTGVFSLDPLTVASFASPNVSQWTNDAGYITAASLPDHNDLNGLQGGTTDEYYHLTAAKYTFLNALTTTTNLPEGSNLYYTDARARLSITAGEGIDYDSATGIVSADINTTNLKFTATEINTIQDINFAATPTFGAVTAYNTLGTSLFTATSGSATSVYGTTSLTGVFGTETNHPISIQTNGVVVGYVDPNSYFGFGNGSPPTYGIHRRGAGNGAIIATETSSGTGDCYNYYVQNGTLKAGIGYKNSLTALTLQTGGIDRLYIDSAGILTIAGLSGVLSAATGVITAGTVSVANGGTGQTSYTNGQLLIGNSVGNTLTKGTLTGIANQIIVTNGTGTITLGLPQDFATNSSPTLRALTETGDSVNDLWLHWFENGSATTGKRLYAVNNYGADNRLIIQAMANNGSFTRSLLSMYHDGNIIAHSKMGVGGVTPISTLHVSDATNPADFSLGVNYSTGGYTALVATLSAVSGGYANIQAIKDSGSNYGNLILQRDGGVLGIGTDTPASILHTKESNSTTSTANGVTIEQASTGDTILQHLLTGGTRHQSGLDNSNGDAYTEGFSSSLGTTPHRIVTTAGEQTMPLQPSVLAYNSTFRTDVTGDGTVYTLIFNTEAYDQNSDFSTSTLTAPVTGKYPIEIGVLIQNIGVLHTSYLLTIITSNGTYEVAAGNPGAAKDANGNIIIQGQAPPDMDIGDTATTTITVSGSTKTIDIGNNNRDTFFGSWLNC